jgi:DivIVA domain-containing protein
MDRHAFGFASALQMHRTTTYAGRVDRDAIERRDFPVGRRGYDQAAVDAHLRRVADAFEELRDSAAAAPLSAGASEQVRVILEAAEAGAARIRADAEREAGEHVARVQEAAAGMLSRLDELEHELATLRDALRRSGERLTGELARFREQVGLAPDAGEPPVTGEDFAAAAPLAGASEEQGDDGDEAGARLIALNMALSGTPREETAKYLSEHFELGDADGLLDDVYARAGR